MGPLERLSPARWAATAGSGPRASAWDQGEDAPLRQAVAWLCPLWGSRPHFCFHPDTDGSGGRMGLHPFSEPSLETTRELALPSMEQEWPALMTGNSVPIPDSNESVGQPSTTALALASPLKQAGALQGLKLGGRGQMEWLPSCSSAHKYTCPNTHMYVHIYMHYRNTTQGT